MNNIQLNNSNYRSAIWSLSFVLFLSGLFGLVLLSIKHFGNELNEHVFVLIELEETLTTDEKLSLNTSLIDHGFIVPGDLEFISKESALDETNEELDSNLKALGFENPFYDMITFKVRSVKTQAEDLVQLESLLEMNLPLVEVYFESAGSENISKNLHRAGRVLFILSIICALIALFLVHNITKLAIYNNRELIKNMDLVGASPAFIQQPFIRQSFKNALISILIALIMLLIVLIFIQSKLPELVSLKYMPSFAVLFLGIAIMGMLISVTGTSRVVKKYLSSTQEITKSGSV